jgi:hypothetical protein
MNSEILSYAMCGFVIILAVVIVPIVVKRHDKKTLQGNDATKE